MDQGEWLSVVNGRTPTPTDLRDLQGNPLWVLIQRRVELQERILAQSRLDKKELPRDVERFDAGQLCAYRYILGIPAELLGAQKESDDVAG